MSDPTLRTLANRFAVASFLAMVCLVECRPPSGGLSQEWIIDHINHRRSAATLPIGSQTHPKSLHRTDEVPDTLPRVLNHPRRSSPPERTNGSIFPASQRDRPLHGSFSGSQSRRDDIIFPTESSSWTTTLGTSTRFGVASFAPDPKMFKSCADGDTFCEDFDAYPTQQVEDLVANSIDKYQAFFGKDKVIEPSLMHKIDDLSEAQLCVSVESTVFPKVAQNEKHKPLFIVNHPSVPESQQGVRVEKCHKTGLCQFSEHFPIGYRAMCKQKYIYRRLLALNPENGEPYPDSFLLPSCCVCAVKMDASPAERMGFPLKPNTTPVQRNAGAAGVAPDAHDDAQSDAPDDAQSDAPMEPLSTRIGDPDGEVSPPKNATKKGASRVVFGKEILEPLPLAIHDDQE
nr:PREDICTED: uncharacterized protein LOC109039908 [Bemisia tabaci]